MDGQTNNFYLLPIIFGNENEPIYIQTTKSVTKLGREENNDIIIPVKSASRVHASLFYLNDNLYIRDHNSTHGTFIAQQKLDSEKNYLLKNLDLIRFSTENVWYEFHDKRSKIENEIEIEIKTSNTLNKSDFIEKETKKMKEYSPFIAYKKLIKEKYKNKDKEQNSDSSGSENINQIEIFDHDLLKNLPDISDLAHQKLENYQMKVGTLQKTQILLEQATANENEEFDEMDFQSNNNSKSLIGLKSKINKIGLEIEELEEEIIETIFKQKKELQKKGERKQFYQENIDLLDLSTVLNSIDLTKLTKEEILKELKNKIIAEIFLLKKKNKVQISLFEKTECNIEDELDFYMKEANQTLLKEEEKFKIEKILECKKEIKDLFFYLKTIHKNEKYNLEEIYKELDNEIEKNNCQNELLNDPIFDKKISERIISNVVNDIKNQEEFNYELGIKKESMTLSEKEIDLKDYRISNSIKNKIDKNNINDFNENLKILTEKNTDLKESKIINRISDISSFFEDLGY